jgi:AraC-like DNA-binding protein
VLDRRLERAKLLLVEQPGRKVLDVALACGIESSTVFYRAFRGAFGMNPGDYRRLLRATGAFTAEVHALPRRVHDGALTHPAVVS